MTEWQEGKIQHSSIFHHLLEVLNVNLLLNNFLLLQLIQSGFNESLLVELCQGEQLSYWIKLLEYNNLLILDVVTYLLWHFLSKDLVMVNTWEIAGFIVCDTCKGEIKAQSLYNLIKDPSIDEATIFYVCLWSEEMTNSEWRFCPLE